MEGDRSSAGTNAIHRAGALSSLSWGRIWKINLTGLPFRTSLNGLAMVVAWRGSVRRLELREPLARRAVKLIFQIRPQLTGDPNGWG